MFEPGDGMVRRTRACSYMMRGDGFDVGFNC